jgi:hypothetical protein
MPEFSTLKDIYQAVPHGLYLCKYLDTELPLRINILAESSSGFALAQMRYSLKLDARWKFAIIDYRLEREKYVCGKSSDSKEIGRKDEKLSQKEIDDRVAELLETN